MALNSAFVDLCDDIESVGTQTATSSLPSSNPTESFERSCDNPECSAPRLISLVPKPTAPEFVTEPVVVHKPTLINGFTTVFRVDGTGTRMEDILNEAEKARSECGENQKPRTVFRVVPNSHAHIVNYVVVEAATETMQKIKENDPETMCKLLVSQRLSAEQMLKKLISKGLESKTTKESLPNPSPSKPPAPIPTEISASKVQPGLTVKLLPTSEENKKPNKSNVSVNTSSNNKLPTKAVSEPNKTPKPVNVEPIKSVTQLQKTDTKPVSKKVPQVIPKTKSTPPEPKTPDQNPRPITSGTRAIAASKPVVWQAVTPAITPKSITTDKITPPVLTRSAQQVVTSSASIPSPPLQSTEFLDVEKSTTATSITVHRSPIDNPNKQQNFNKRRSDVIIKEPEAIKRLRPRSPNRAQNATPLAGNITNVDDTTPVTRKLPTIAQKPQKISVPPQKEQVGRFLLGSKQKANPNDSGLVITPSSATSNKKSTLMIEEVNVPGGLNTPIRRKVKPLMGPASKMKELKALSDAKTKKINTELLSSSQTAINTETIPIKIGETTITRTGSLKSAQEKSKEPVEKVTKPCSVAITDIVKNSTTTDSDSDNKSKKVGPTLRSTADKEPCVKTKYDTLMDTFRGRWIIQNEEERSRKPNLRPTRSTTSSKATAGTDQKTESALESSKNISDSPLLTTPSAPSRVLRVVLPSTKNGIVNSPPTSPHPNLKISSVISSGERKLPKVAGDGDDESDTSGPGIEQLQKELADLRRTVAKLTQGKKA